MKENVYETLWRNKFLCTDCTTFDEFIGTLEGAVEELKRMRAAGVKLEEEGIGDDYAHFTTTDPEIAKKFNMEVMDWGGEDEEFEEDDKFFVVNSETQEIMDETDNLQDATFTAHEDIDSAKIGSVFYIKNQGKKVKKLTKLLDGSIVAEDVNS